MDDDTNYIRNAKATLKTIIKMTDCRSILEYGLKDDLIKLMLHMLIVDKQDQEKQEQISKEEIERLKQVNERYEKIVHLITEPGPLYYKEKIIKIKQICKVPENSNIPIVKEWINECLEPTTNEETPFEISYKDFRDWLENKFGPKLNIQRKDVWKGLGGVGDIFEGRMIKYKIKNLTIGQKLEIEKFNKVKQNKYNKQLVVLKNQTKDINMESDEMFEIMELEHKIQIAD